MWSEYKLYRDRGLDGSARAGVGIAIADEGRFPAGVATAAEAHEGATEDDEEHVLGAVPERTEDDDENLAARRLRMQSSNGSDMVSKLALCEEPNENSRSRAPTVRYKILKQVCKY